VTFDEAIQDIKILTSIDVLYKGTGYMKSSVDGPCWHCGTLTHWIDTDFQARICSTECSDIKWDEFYRACERLEKDDDE
jgi:hypothetical protein